MGVMFCNIWLSLGIANHLQEIKVSTRMYMFKGILIILQNIIMC